MKKYANYPRFLLFSFTLLLLLAFGTGCPKSGEEIDIFMTGDTNRDGRIDFKQDTAGTGDWTEECGAIFLNNCDSDQNTGRTDWSDEVVNGEEDLKDLAPIKIKKIKNLPQESLVSVSVDETSLKRINLFLKNEDENFELIDLEKKGNIKAAQLKKQDLELRLESNSFADADWNGKTYLKISVELPNSVIKEQTICLKAAPFILLSNLQKGKTLYVRAYPGRNDVFIGQLKEIVPKAEAELFILQGEGSYPAHEIWFQDAMEIGYTEMPGRKMNVVLQANRGRALDEFPFNELLGPDYGCIRVGNYREAYARGRGGNGWLDWYGNLEVTPPLPEFPFGRIVYGFNPDGPADASLNPEIVSMLEAQQIQSPAVRLDTGWLTIKHVDEMVSFLPPKNPERPFCVMVVSPEAMINLLEKWKAEGYGEAQVLKRFYPGTTVSGILENEKLIKHNIYLQQERIEPNIMLIKNELKLKEDDIIRIPALFTEDGRALFPNMVNSAHLNDYLLISDPDGPVINGSDLLKEEMKKLLAGVPIQPVFLDDTQYHKWSGNVHCATNIQREGLPEPWYNIELKKPE